MTNLFEQFKQKVGEPIVAGNVWDREYASLQVTDETIQEIKSQLTKYRGGVRLATGRVYTDHEKAELLQSLREVELP